MSGYAFEIVRGESYKGQTIRVDGKHFIDCHFDGCILKFGATAPFQIEGESSLGNIQWSFVENAGATIEVMRLLYQLGHTDTVEQMFDHIRGQGLADAHVGELRH